jgi:hypothetical protein
VRNAALAALLALPGMAAGSAKADQLVADYTAYWAGLPAAQIRLKLSNATAAYRDEIEIRTEGLPHLVTHFRAVAQAGGRLVPEGAAAPSRYSALYDLRKYRDRRIGMQFVTRDAAVIAERTPDDTSRKPSLAEKYRRDIVDPLTALERMRAAIAARKGAGDAVFVVPVYDGTRRFDIVGHILPKAEQAAGTLRVALNLRPIAGFKGETSDDGDPDNAPRPVALTLTDDARLLPISVSVRVFYLPLVIQLDRVCSDAKACPG